MRFMPIRFLSKMRNVAVAITGVAAIASVVLGLPRVSVYATENFCCLNGAEIPVGTVTTAGGGCEFCAAGVPDGQDGCNMGGGAGQWTSSDICYS